MSYEYVSIGDAPVDLDAGFEGGVAFSEANRSELDEGLPLEYAFWEANKEVFIEEHPEKYLVIRGEKVEMVLDDLDEVVAAGEGMLADGLYLVRSTHKRAMVFTPFSQAVSIG